jgi:hypothetical protein
MAAAVGLRGDFTATGLRRLAQRRRDAGQVRRLLSLAVIYDGGSRSEAARTGGVGLQTVRDWVLRFICPAKGKGAALVLPRCNTEGMNLHLAEISAAVVPGAHAVSILDQAGWHLSAGLLCLEPPHRSALAHHVTRTAVVGSWVNISESWYKTPYPDGSTWSVFGNRQLIGVVCACSPRFTAGKDVPKRILRIVA